MPSGEVHIVPHPSAAVSFTQAFGPDSGLVLANFDYLSCGPLREFTSLDTWSSIRRTYWGTFWEGGEEFFSDPRDIHNNTDALRDAAQIVLWVGTILDDQLLLVWVPQLLKHLEIDEARLKVVQFTQEPETGREVVSVATLNPRRLAAHPAPQRLGAAAIADLHHAWAAVTHPDPTTLLSFLSRSPGELQFLRTTLRYLLGRFPDAATGLNDWERQLLEWARIDSRAVAIVEQTLKTNDSPDRVSDLYLFPLMCALADATHPLLSRRGLAMGEAHFWLTDTGHKVLAGEANVIDLNGIDEWVCGTHLDSNVGNVWLRRGDSLVLGGPQRAPA